jgi:hypothetical protein
VAALTSLSDQFSNGPETLLDTLERPCITGKYSYIVSNPRVAVLISLINVSTFMMAETDSIVPCHGARRMVIIFKYAVDSLLLSQNLPVEFPMG